MGNEFHNQLTQEKNPESLKPPFSIGKVYEEGPKIEQKQVMHCRVESVAVKNYLKSDKEYQQKMKDCRPIILEDGTVYTGPLDANKVPNGYGKILYQDGGILLAQFKEGTTSGKCTRVYSNQSTYKGQLVKGKACGNGCFENKQIKYDGPFKDNLFHGTKGVLDHKGPLLYRFQGEFKSGKMKYGQLRWQIKPEGTNPPQICTYQGEFSERNLFNGSGKLITQKGQYIGAFKDGKKDGKGKFFFKNGLMFVGQYKNGLREGQGTIYNADKKSKEKYKEETFLIAYTGPFKDDNPHGKGKIYDPETKQLIEVDFQKGVNKNGDLFLSEMKNEHP